MIRVIGAFLIFVGLFSVPTLVTADETTEPKSTYIEGSPHYYTDETGEKSENLYVGNENIDFLKENKLKILKNGDTFIWANNGNVELVKTEKILKSDDGKDAEYTVFSSPSGQGLIIVKHVDYKDYPQRPIYVGDIPLNYKEYRLSANGDLVKYEGRVSTWFYPAPPEAWLHRPPVSINKKHSIKDENSKGFVDSVKGIFSSD